MIWVACCAIYLACVSLLAGEARTTFDILLVLGQSLLFGTCWAAGIVLLVQAISGHRLSVQPGHWLLALMGAVAACEVVLAFLPGDMFRHSSAVSHAIACWLFVLPMFARNLETRWKAYFAVLVTVYVLPIILASPVLLGMREVTDFDMAINAAFPYFGNAAMAGALLSTTYLDRLAERRRDELHWFGVVVFLLVCVTRFFGAR